MGREPLVKRADGWHSDLEMFAAKYGLWRSDQDWTGRPPVEPPMWTVAYRTSSEPVIHRAQDFRGTWQEAHDMAGEVAIAHPEYDEIYYTLTREAELSDYNGAKEDILNIMVSDGTRVPIADDGTIK